MTKISDETVALIRKMKVEPCPHCEGFLTNKAIARRLGLNPGTVRNITGGNNPRSGAGERRG
ncbi:response regulator transcription factor [Sphingobium sp. LMC3-1-1.1]|uniref:hypothetical protein n=1 Tax=Sphingobium sp. LMC3-1-1.1 TaxID=3135241 RepID=UPI003427A9ED